MAQAWPRFQSQVASDAQARADYVATVAAHGRSQTQKALESALNKRVEFVLADVHGVVDASVLTFAEQFPAFADVDTPEAVLQTPRVRGLLQDTARLLGASTLKTCLEAATTLEQAVTAGNMAAAQEALLTQKGLPRKLSDKVVGIETVRQAQDCLMDVAQAQAQHEAWLHQQSMARLTRVLVVEYKGEAYATNDDSREKKAVGAAWQRASSGQAVFVMVERELHGQDMRQQLLRAIGG